MSCAAAACDDAAARQLAQVSRALLPWLRAAAGDDSDPLDLGADADAALEAADAFVFGDELRPALRALLARADAARLAARLAASSKEARDAVRACCAELVDAAGAACCAHADAMQRIVRQLAADEHVRADDAIGRRVVELCRRSSFVPATAQRDPALMHAMLGATFLSPMMRAAVAEEAARLPQHQSAASAAAAPWKQLAYHVDECLARMGPLPTAAEFFGASGPNLFAIAGSPVFRQLMVNLQGEFSDDNTANLLDALSLQE